MGDQVSEQMVDDPVWVSEVRFSVDAGGRWSWSAVVGGDGPPPVVSGCQVTLVRVDVDGS